MVETLHFFDREGEDVAQIVVISLSKLLVPYDYMAGRLNLNPEEGRLEIDCNGGGALFAAATSELTLDQLPDIVYPNPAFTRLILQDYEYDKHQDLPLLFL
jgi:omega-hydroxypalmitate O-feruloyl transferase